MTGASRDEKIDALIRAKGPIAYARYWRVLEAIAEQMNESEKCEVTYSWAMWSRITWASNRQQAESNLRALAEHSLITVSATDEQATCSCPKLLEIRARRKPIGRERGRAEVEVEVEVEEERERVPPAPPPVQTALPSPDNRDGLTPLSREWNRTAQSLPKVLKMSEDRKRKEKARLKSLGYERLRMAIEKAESLPFAKGSNDRGWKMTYDWLISSDNNVMKLLEGKYDRQEESWAQRAKDNLKKEGLL